MKLYTKVNRFIHHELDLLAGCSDTCRNIVHFFIFETRWILIPFYLKLVWTLFFFLYRFIFGEVGSEDVVRVLQDVDVVMIANLVKMIITGSYTSFVDKTHVSTIEKISSSALKVKMATSLIGVSSIHLLQQFLKEPETMHDWNFLIKLITIHVVFLAGALILSVIDLFHAKAEALHPESHEPSISSSTPCSTNASHNSSHKTQTEHE